MAEQFIKSSNDFLGMTANGDIARNRSSFVNFTITDPETRQITAAGQIPLLSSPSTSSHQNINSKYFNL